MSDQLVLEAKSVSKFFGTITALQNVDLHLNKGEVLGVVGDNGAGKSTLMKVSLCFLHCLLVDHHPTLRDNTCT